MVRTAFLYKVINDRFSAHYFDALIDLIALHHTKTLKFVVYDIWMGNEKIEVRRS
jgi:hypothetical protein